MGCRIPRRERPSGSVEILDQLVEVLIRFSYRVTDRPEIREIDVNPLLAIREQVTALDARIVVESEAMRRPILPYEHLVLRPGMQALFRNRGYQLRRDPEGHVYEVEKELEPPSPI